MKPWIGPSVAGLGILVVAATAILGWIVIPNIIENQIIEEVRLVNGTDTWDKWQEIPVPVYLKFYMYNVENPDEVEQGGKPNITEKGPYSYRETRTKVNISLLSDEVVEYEQVILYFFDNETSCPTCHEDDEYNIVNIAFLTIVSVIHNLSPGLASLIANSVLGSETLIRRNVKVRELTFEGFDVRLYTQSLGFLLPEEFGGGRFGLYKVNNGSADGVYQIYTGVGRTSDFGRVKQWEGVTMLNDWWQPNTPCAAINGTEGTLFPPFIEKSFLMYIFVTDLCRTLHLVYEKEVEHQDIKGYRFVAPKDLLEDPRTNKNNECFCMEPNPDMCLRGGAIHIGTCKSGAPIIMSTPHFLDGYPEYLEMSGLSPPEKDLHQTVIDIEPNTGLTLAANKRIQVNLEVKRIPQIKALANVAEYMVFPLLWADEEGRLDEENADDLKSRLLTPLKIVNISKWSLLGVGCLVVGIGAGIFIASRRRKSKEFV